MTECRQIESLLPPYVDGEAPADAVAAVEAHLAACPACRQQVAAQRTVRMVLRARSASLLGGEAPLGLRARIVSALGPASPRLSWAWRLSAVGAAAVVVLALTAGFELISLRSPVLLAAQLAIDHVRCFVVERASTASADAAAAERSYANDYGWNVSVPPSNETVGLTFVAARRCPFWLGDHAHLLYRKGVHDVSLYVTPGASRRAGAALSADVNLFGHAERIWTAGDATFALVARGVPNEELAPIAAYLAGASAGATAP